MKTPEWSQEPEPVTLYINTYCAKSKGGIVYPAGVRVAAGLTPEPHHYHHILDMQTYSSLQGVHVVDAYTDGKETYRSVEIRSSFMITNPDNDPESAINSFLVAADRDELITSFWGLERALGLAEALRAEPVNQSTDRKRRAIFQLLPQAIDHTISMLPSFRTVASFSSEKPTLSSPQEVLAA